MWREYIRGDCALLRWASEQGYGIKYTAELQFSDLYYGKSECSSHELNWIIHGLDFYFYLFVFIQKAKVLHGSIEWNKTWLCGNNYWPLLGTHSYIYLFVSFPFKCLRAFAIKWITADYGKGRIVLFNTQAAAHLYSAHCFGRSLGLPPQPMHTCVRMGFCSPSAPFCTLSSARDRSVRGSKCLSCVAWLQ